MGLKALGCIAHDLLRTQLVAMEKMGILSWEFTPDVYSSEIMIPSHTVLGGKTYYQDVGKFQEVNN